VKIQLLGKTHNRKNFTCEEDSLTEYIRKQVSQDIRKRLAMFFPWREYTQTTNTIVFKPNKKLLNIKC